MTIEISNAPEAQIVKFTTSKEDSGKLIVDLIADNSTLSKSLIKKLMTIGAVFQTFKNTRLRARKAKRTTKSGDLIECYFDPSKNVDEDFKFTTLFYSKYYGIYHKPTGALTEGTNYTDKISLFRHVEKTKKFVHLVNRLDKETEGLVIIAYDSKTQNLLQQMLRSEVTKKYQAIVQGKLEGEGEFDYSINNKFTKTKYKSVNATDEQSHIDISLISDRKHQIRIHFSKAGHPIVGDFKYSKQPNDDGALKLIANQLEFIDPYTKKLVNISLPPERLLF